MTFRVRFLSAQLDYTQYTHSANCGDVFIEVASLLSARIFRDLGQSRWRGDSEQDDSSVVYRYDAYTSLANVHGARSFRRTHDNFENRFAVADHGRD